MSDRLPIIDLTSGTEEQRAALLEWSADRNQPTAPGGLWGMLVHSPEGMRRVGKLGAFARFGTGLPERAREAAIYLAVCHVGFTLEKRIHGETLRRLGADADELQRLEQGETEGLPSEIQAAARLARSMARGDAVDDAVCEAARSTFGERGVVELAITVGYYLMLAGLARVFTPEPQPPDRR